MQNFVEYLVNGYSTGYFTRDQKYSEWLSSYSGLGLQTYETR